MRCATLTRMRVVAVVLGVVVVVTACSRGQQTRRGRTAGDEGLVPSTSELWKLAPPEASAGLVVADGALDRYLDAARASREVLGAAASMDDAVRDQIGALSRMAGFEVLSRQAWEERGLDLSRGLALFAARTENDISVVAAVLPVVDRGRFRRWLDGNEEMRDERSVDAFERWVCAVMKKRYVCATSWDVARRVADEAPTSLAQHIELLPPARRGDVELYVDLDRMTSIEGVMSGLEDFEALSASARLGSDRITIQGWMPGRMNPDALARLQGHAPTAGFQQTGAQATTVWRGRTAVTDAWLAHTFADLVGDDFQLVTAGGGLVSGAAMFGAPATATSTETVETMCARAEYLEPEGEITADLADAVCTIDVDLGLKLGLSAPLLLSLQLSSVADTTTMLVGSPNLPELEGSVVNVTASRTLEKLLTEPQTLAVWSRHLDVDFAQALSILGGEADPGELPAVLRDASQTWRWLSAHVYQAGAGFHVAEDGVRFSAQVITFADDPLAAKKAYYDLVWSRLFDGEEKPYIARRAELARQYPDSFIAERVRLEDAGVPSVGLVGYLTGLGLFDWLVRGFPGGPAPEDLSPADTGDAPVEPAVP